MRCACARVRITKGQKRERERETDERERVGEVDFGPRVPKVHAGVAFVVMPCIPTTRVTCGNMYINGYELVNIAFFRHAPSESLEQLYSYSSYSSQGRMVTSGLVLLAGQNCESVFVSFGKCPLCNLSCDTCCDLVTCCYRVVFCPSPWCLRILLYLCVRVFNINL